jgi:deazaflavin-dependent oxidoreductase (nitroreductase family)
MADDWNAKIIREFRENGGKVGGNFAGAPLLLLHTTGAKTGEDRVHPMMYMAGDHELYVFASFNGAPVNPAWYHNLVANPHVELEVGSERYAATATPLIGAKRDKIFAEQARRYPGFAEYEAKTTRTIPVVALSRS